jgi:hypothetical protein
VLQALQDYHLLLLETLCLLHFFGDHRGFGKHILILALADGSEALLVDLNGLETRGLRLDVELKPTFLNSFDESLVRLGSNFFQLSSFFFDPICHLTLG